MAAACNFTHRPTLTTNGATLCVLFGTNSDPAAGPVQSYVECLDIAKQTSPSIGTATGRWCVPELPRKVSVLPLTSGQQSSAGWLAV